LLEHEFRNHDRPRRGVAAPRQGSLGMVKPAEDAFVEDTAPVWRRIHGESIFA